MKFFFFQMLFSLAAYNLSAQIVAASDTSALLKLREKTGAGTGTVITGWMTNVSTGQWLPGVVPPAQWAGLTFVPDQGGALRVKSINLAGLGLTDSLPSDFFSGGGLDSLSSINLSNNNIQYANQGTWFSAPNTALRTVNISNNKFEYNSLMFNRMLTNAQGLEELSANNYLDSAQIGRGFPGRNAATFANLKRLSMNDNSFAGVIPNPVTISPNIQELYLSNNNFQSIDTTGAAPTQLRVLDISNNDIGSILYLKDVLGELPALKILSARNALNGSQHNLQDLGPIVLSDFAGGTMDLGQNRLTGALVLSSTELGRLKVLRLDSNQVANLVPPTARLDSLQVLDIAHNQILVQMDSMHKVFMNLPAIEVLKMNNNNFVGKLPTLTILNSPQTPPFDNLKELDLSNNNIFGKVQLDLILARQIQSGTGKLKKLNLSNNVFEEINISNITQASFDSLSEVNVSRNKLNFKDLHRLAKDLRMVKVTNGAYYDYYAPARAINDSLAFDYRAQRPRGVGGARRRPALENIYFDALNPEPIDGTDSTLWSTYTWYQSPDSSINPAGHTLIGRYRPGIGATNLLSGFTVAPSILGGLRRNILLAENINTVVHGNKNYYAIVTNDSFPLVQIPTDSRRLIVGDCIDSLGRPIKCQEVIIQFDEAYLNSLENADSVKTALREEMGITIIDSCLCGSIELWELSDTANILLVEQFGSGTRTSAGQANNKAELLSADPNYDLLSSATGVYTPPTSFPAGTAHTKPTLVAIIDSGVDYDHPDLADKIWVNRLDTSQNNNDNDADCLDDNGWGYNFIDKNNRPSDDHGHGTNVAGIVSGQSTHNIVPNSGFDSIAILPLKYTNKDGAGTVFHAACAIRHAADYSKYNAATGDSIRVRVINASWGYYGEPTATLYNAIEYAASKYDMVFITSAGNDGINNDTAAHYPSDFDLPNIISVAATQSTANAGNPEQLEAYSNFGANEVDLAAAGYDITTDNGVVGTKTVEGTSFATAQVSRVAALLMHEYPDATYCTVIQAMKKGVDVLNSADSLKLSSKGKLNYQKAKMVLDTMTNRSDCSFSTGIAFAPDFSDEDLLETVRVYPNPINDLLFVEIPAFVNSNQSLELSLINVNGQLIYNNNMDANSGERVQISMQQIPAGMYFLQLRCGNSRKIEKLIKFE